MFEYFQKEFPVTAKYISGIEANKWLTHEWAADGLCTFGVKTSNSGEQENSPTGILGKVRSLPPLPGMRVFLDVTSKRMVDVINSISKKLQKHEQLELQELPAPFFYRVYNEQLEKATTLKSYKVVNRTSSGVADVSYYCGENQRDLVCKVNLEQSDPPYGTCFFACTYGSLCSHAMKVVRELPGNNSYALQFKCLRKFYPENCTIQDWKDSVDKAWHKEAEEEIDQLNSVPINRIDVPSEMELSVLPSISCLPIRRPPSEIKGKHLGKTRKRIPSAGEKEQKKKAHSFTAFNS